MTTGIPRYSPADVSAPDPRGRPLRCHPVRLTTRAVNQVVTIVTQSAGAGSEEDPGRTGNVEDGNELSEGRYGNWKALQLLETTITLPFGKVMLSLAPPLI